TPVIVSNVYYLLRKTAKHSMIVEKIKQLLTIIEVVKMDKNVVLSALNSEFKDFEDALQNFSAIENGQIKIILTRNLTDFKKSEIRSRSSTFGPYVKWNATDKNICSYQPKAQRAYQSTDILPPAGY